MLNRAIVLIVLAVVAAALLAYSQYRTAPLKVSGLIEAHEIRIGSRVGGRVQDVLVEEGATVEKGETLIELEPYDLDQRRAQAAAELAAQSAEYEKLVKGFAVKRSRRRRPSTINLRPSWPS